MTAHDLFAFKTVNDPQVAPDGTRVVFTVTELDEADNCYRAALWLVDLEGGEPRKLTSGRARDGQPRWAPDGARLAFTSDRNPDGAGKGQIWLLDIGGGEPTRLTRLAEPVEEFVWAPDGKSIACVSKVRHGQHNPDSDLRVIRTPRFKFDGEGFLDDKYRQLFVVDVATGVARQLTDGPFETRNPAWSSTGHEIACVSNREAGWEFSAVEDIYAVRPASGLLRRVSDGTGAWRAPAWSPDGTRIACLGTRRLESDSARTEVCIVPAAGGAPQSLTADFDRSFTDGAIADVWAPAGRPPLWDRDGKTVTVVYSDQGAVQLARIGADDGEIVPLTRGRQRAGAAALTHNGGCVYVRSDAVSVGELYVRDASGRNERRLTSFNDDFAAEVEIREPEPFVVDSADGTPIHGWVIKPVGFQVGKKYPLLLEIHGGPFGMYGESLFHEFQVLTARGYVVLYTNPRGSTGYGDDFAGQLFRAWGKHDFPDVMAAVDGAIAQGYVDEQRLGVLGGSYGGFMTNWVISHTTRFKAAVTQRCVSNMYSTFGTDDIFFASAEQTIGALPWDEPEIYWELSPITYVDRIETPLLIEHQEHDYRCPIEQAEQLFTALKRCGKIVEFDRYPDESHGMSRTGQPKHRIERLNRICEWFDRYV
jgi:dipeptidyl aminopeptidase/acylaminoacyl peptidase